MDSLIFTIIAAGLFGGILFLVTSLIFLASMWIHTVDDWSNARAVAKVDTCILIDRIRRKWCHLLPVFRLRHGDIWGHPDKIGRVMSEISGRMAAKGKTEGPTQ